jgi:hypothetical protein
MEDRQDRNLCVHEVLLMTCLFFVCPVLGATLKAPRSRAMGASR